MVTVFDVAVAWVTHPSELVIITETTSLLASEAFWYVELFVPTFVPFSFHWNEGEPPFCGVAVKITFVPAQIVVALAAILTAGVTVVVTDIVMELDVAVAGTAHGNEDVITTLTTSLLANPAF
jgi:hypothetical protein